VNIGRAAGDPLAIPHALLLRKRATLRGLSTAMDLPHERAAAFGRLLDHVAAGRLTMDHDVLALEDVGAAWQRLADGAGRKLVVRIRA
jgi:NADPH-dependent curcumin reductase CurA